MRIFIWATVLLTCLGISAQPAGAEAGPDPELPSAIEAYYLDRNFVAAFTTHRERVALALGRPADQPATGMNGKRLREAFLCLQRMNAREIDQDSQIAQGRSPFQRAATFSGWAETETAFLVRANALKVHLVVYRLSPALNQQLIQRFDHRSPGRPLLPADPGHYLGTPEVSHREIHTWIKTEGRWQKEWLAIAQTL